jgi:hypothetical protein
MPGWTATTRAPLPDIRTHAPDIAHGSSDVQPTEDAAMALVVPTDLPGVAGVAAGLVPIPVLIHAVVTSATAARPIVPRSLQRRRDLRPLGGARLTLRSAEVTNGTSKMVIRTL